MWEVLTEKHIPKIPKSTIIEGEKKRRIDIELRRSERIREQERLIQSFGFKLLALSQVSTRMLMHRNFGTVLH